MQSLDEAATTYYNITGKTSEYLSENCASALFISELLTESYMLPSDTAVIHVAQSVDGTEVCMYFYLFYFITFVR